LFLAVVDVVVLGVVVFVLIGGMYLSPSDVSFLEQMISSRYVLNLGHPVRAGFRLIVELL